MKGLSIAVASILLPLFIISLSLAQQDKQQNKNNPPSNLPADSPYPAAFPGMMAGSTGQQQLMPVLQQVVTSLKEMAAIVESSGTLSSAKSGELKRAREAIRNAEEQIKEITRPAPARLQGAPSAQPAPAQNAKSSKK